MTNSNNSHNHEHSFSSLGGLRTAFFLNAAFTLIEIVGGFLSNSLAIVSDALHDLGDSLSLGFSWYMEQRSHRPASGPYSYGFRRISLLAALINASVLIAGSVLILSQAIPRLLYPEQVNAPAMLILSVLGIAVNGLALLRLRAAKTMNAKTVAWHLWEDVLGWIAVLIVGVTLLFTDMRILDPLLSIAITSYVLYNVLRNARQTTAIFLQAAPPDLDVRHMEHALSSIPNVLSTHHTHAWSLDGEHHVFTTHLVVPAQASKEEVLAVKRSALRLMEQADFEHTTIEVEYEDEDCRMRSS